MRVTKISTKKKKIAIPWYKEVWFMITSGVIILAALFGLLNDGSEWMSRNFKSAPKEIEIRASPIKIKYSKGSGGCVAAGVEYSFQAKTYMIDGILSDSITLSNIKIKKEMIIFSDSLTNRYIPILQGTSSEIGDETTLLYGIDVTFNLYLSVKSVIANAKPGSVFDIGYATFLIPYIVEGVKKVKEQKVPIHLEVS